MEEKSLIPEEVLTSLQKAYRDAIYSKKVNKNLDDIISKFLSNLDKLKIENDNIVFEAIGTEILRYQKIMQDKEFKDTLKSWLNKLTDLLNYTFPDFSVSIDCRQKSFESVLRKSIFNYYKDVSIDLFDLIAFRIIIDSSCSEEQEKHFCYLVKDACILFFTQKACTLSTPAKIVGTDNRFKDYVSFPKKNGYQSLHLAFKTLTGHVFECQIRTLKMHEFAELQQANWSEYKDQKYELISEYISFKISKETLPEIPLFRILCNNSLYDKIGLIQSIPI